MEFTAVKVKEEFQTSESINQTVTNTFQGHGSTGLQFLLDDPLLLQDLVADEKRRGLDDQIDLEPPIDNQPLRVIGWYRLSLAFSLFEVHIKVIDSSDQEPVVLVIKLDAVDINSSKLVDLRNVKNMTRVPFYVAELLTGEEQHTTDYSTGFILLSHNVSHGWEMAGYLDPSASSQSSPEDCGSVVGTDLTPVLPPASIPIKVVMYIVLLFISIDGLLLIIMFILSRKKNPWTLC